MRNAGMCDKEPSRIPLNQNMSEVFLLLLLLMLVQACLFYSLRSKYE